MTNEVHLLNNIAPYPTNDIVQVGNGKHLHITHIGNAMLGFLKLQSVLLIHELTAIYYPSINYAHRTIVLFGLISYRTRYWAKSCTKD